VAKEDMTLQNEKKILNMFSTMVCSLILWFYLNNCCSFRVLWVFLRPAKAISWQYQKLCH